MTDSSETDRNPLFARTYDLLNAGAESSLFPEHRRWIAHDLNGRVLDLGTGTGAMLPYYRDASNVCEITGVDADEAMLDRCAVKAAEFDVDVDLVPGRAESLPFPDEHFDVVVAALVLCSVDDLDSALDEVERVLTSDGEFRYFEHVRSDGLRGRVESTVAPYWSPIVGGCRIDRRTGERIHARFEVLEHETLDIGNYRTFPVRRFVRGRAVPK